MFANRFLRIALAFILIIALAVAGVVAALFFWINEASVKKSVEELSTKALNAAVVFDGPVKVSRLSSMQVELPAMTFVEKDNPDVVIGRVAGVRAEVSMWSLALGALQVKSATVSGLEGRLTIPALSGNALFDSTFANIFFPDDLRLNNVTLQNAKLDLFVTKQNQTFGYRLSDLYLTMDKLSPEVTTPFELSAQLKPLPAIEQASEPRVDDVTSNDAATDLSDAQTPESPSPDDSQVQPSPSNETEGSSAPAESNQNAPEETQQQAPSNDAPAGDANPDTNADSTNQSAFVRDLFGIQTVHAQAPEYLRNEAIFLSFDPNANTVAFSAKGSMTISSQDRYVVFENISFSGETSVEGEALTTVAKADLVRFKDEEVSGSNLSMSISRPQQLSGDIHLGAVNFRIRPDAFESPELRLSYAKQSDPRTTTLEMTSAVKSDFEMHKTDLENFSCRITVTGDPTLPADFSASLSGFVHIDQPKDSASVGLSGSFANAPFSYNGSVSQLDSPRFAGELMIGEINTSTVPAFQSLAWMHMVSFDGSLRVGKILWKALSATQLHAKLSLADGTATLTDVIVNTADGRITGDGAFKEDTSWEFNGKLDGVSLDKILSGFETTPVLSGIAGGQLSLAGQGYNAQTVKSNAQIRVLRGAYHGIDAIAARTFVTGHGTQDAVTRPGAETAIDEADATISVVDNRLTVDNISARTGSLRTQAQFAVDLTTGELTGEVRNSYPPMHGIPSVHIAAQINGSAASPQWQFAWNEADSALRRAMGKPLVDKSDEAATKDKPKKSEKSLWDSVKDFFKF